MLPITWSAKFGVSPTRKRNRRRSITASVVSETATAAACESNDQRHLTEGVVGPELEDPAVRHAQLHATLDDPEHLLAVVARLEDHGARRHLTGLGRAP